MDGINQNKANFTNLAETYMYDRKAGDRLNRNFYKYYRNNANDIDDPIFTGFTFDIDTLHSPLFFTGSGYEASDMLRAIDGGGDSLSKIIETRMTDVYKIAISGSPDSYEINTISTKDTIGGSHLAGFGSQDKFYLDNVQYGATDYIYMVDKVSTGRYSDEIGVYDVGNGTPNVSEYTQQSETLDTIRKILSSPEIDLSNVDISNMDKEDFKKIADEAKKKKATELTQEVINEHDAKEKAYNDAKKDYEDLAGKSGETYKSKVKDLDDLTSKVNNEKSNVSSKLTALQTDAERLLDRLQRNVTDSSIHQNIDATYKSFEDFYTKLATEYPNIDVTTSKIIDNFEEYEKNISDDIYKDPYKNKFQKCWKIIDFKIIGKNVKDSTNKNIDEKKSEINEIEKKLFGVDGDGATLSEYNPSKDSLVGKMNTAEDEMNKDKYTQITNTLQNIEEVEKNYDDFKKYNEYTSDKRTTQEQIPFIDNSAGSGEKIERTTTEVPQTVYDMLGFISGMKKLTEKYPYILQSVSGLDEAYKKYFLMTEPYQGSAKDKITIRCYESLDLRVTSMFNKYFNAVYDRQYKRERVPVNLRRFQCSIFVHDIRNFRNTLGRGIFSNNFPESETGDGVEKIIELALNYMSVIEFKFFDCEISQEDTGNIFDSVSNADAGDMKQTDFSFTYGNCVINFLPFEVLNRYHKGSGWVNGNNDNIYKKEDILSPTMSAKEEEHARKTSEEQMKIFKDADSGDFRMWFDKSEIGNVNNNDYREYYKSTSSVYVDDYFRTTIANDFALGSLARQNKELTDRENALVKYILGVSASTGLPVERVTDALNIKYIDKLFTEADLATPIIKKIGNVTNIEEMGINSNTYTAKKLYEEETNPPTATDLGNVFDDD